MADKYPGTFRCLPADFERARSDNLALCALGAGIYAEPFVRLEPAPAALGYNRRGGKVSTSVKFGAAYVLWAVGTSLYKIGCTRDFTKRFKNLSSASPLPLTVVKYGRCDNPHRLERLLHERFKQKLFKNEWFSLGDDDLAEVAAIFDRYFEPLEPRHNASPRQ